MAGKLRNQSMENDDCDGGRQLAVESTDEATPVSLMLTASLEETLATRCVLQCQPKPMYKASIMVCQVRVGHPRKHQPGN